jgi:class 3 adenylate cyclase/tetratricopeptide (TPR) repeat protein
VIPPKICANCKSENRQQARFCRNCGTWLLANCPYCEAELPSAALFCDCCGQPLSSKFAGLSLWAGEDQAELRLPDASAREGIPLAQHAACPPADPDGRSHLQEIMPPELLEKLQVTRDQGGMIGERRIVTMLFCDVKGSTATAEQLDPEDWSEIMNGAFTHMIKPVYRYEGTVARLMGDGLLAFFGAPIAHEDEPQRALLAALEIVSGIEPYREHLRQTYGLDFAVRVGVNTGLVVVGAVGSDLRMEYSALGDAVNVAARMEQTAQPGTVQVAHATQRLVASLFEFEALGGVQVKGKAAPVSSYRVIGPKANAKRTRGIEGLRADMVGREAEFDALQRAVADLRRGVGRIAFVVGEAGLGKTRLIDEARKKDGNLVQGAVAWIEALSPSYDSNQAYGLLQRLIRRMGGPAHDDPGRIVEQKLAAAVGVLEAGERSPVLQVLRTLFGLVPAGSGGMNGEVFKQDLLDAMRVWWKARFSGRPTVLVFDDLHWCDAASIALLHDLMPLVDDIPVLFLCAMRGERGAPAWRVKAQADQEFGHRYLEIDLQALSEADSGALIDRLLGDPDLPEPLRHGILEKAGGNPFFIEEVVRALIDKGVLVPMETPADGGTVRRWRALTEEADFAIPDNLQSLLAARLDQLEDATRATLQWASVIGRTFDHRVLQLVADAGADLDRQLTTLRSMDLIREAARVPEVEYAFRNPLTQEAVYQTILLKRRRQSHKQVALAMESIHVDRPEPFSGLMAHHFALAEETAKAIEYLRKAARHAVGLFAYEDAAQNLRTALSLLESDSSPETRLGLYEELGEALRLLRDLENSIEAYNEAIQVWTALPAGDPLAAIHLRARIVQVATEAKWYTDVPTYERIRAMASPSIEALDDMLPPLASTPHEPVVLALTVLSYEAWRGRETPDWQRAEEYAQAAVSMAGQLDNPAVLSRALAALGNVLDGRSQLREHVRVSLRRLDVTAGLELDDPFERVDAVCAAGMALMYVGEYDQAGRFLHEAETLAEKAHSVGHQTAAIGLQAQIAFRLDRWDDVLAQEEKWRNLERRYSRQRVGPTCFNVALSASVLGLRGQIHEAEAYARESYDYMVLGSGGRDGWQRNQFY